MSRRTPILLAVAITMTPLWWSPLDAAPEPKWDVLTGKVVPAGELANKAEIKLDRDAIPGLVFFEHNGKSYPILKDAGGRRFFKDERLLNKEYRITGRIVGGTMLQVIAVQSIKDGQPHDIYYWCDICAIRRAEKNDCECCGAEMELREEPLRK
jgi:hypothetical protein